MTLGQASAMNTCPVISFAHHFAKQ